MAESLARGERPADQHYGLMVVPLLDGFRADDRPALCLLRERVERLIGLVPEDLGWSADFLGRLAGLLVAAELGEAVLIVEHFGDDAAGA